MRKSIQYLACPPLILALAGPAFAGEEKATPSENSAPPTEDFTLFPIPDYTGDFWERDALLGDLGFRTALAEKGLQFEGELTQIYQGLIDGGRPLADSDWDYSGTADYIMKLDTGKAGLWPGGFLTVHGETFYGSTVNLKTGSLLPANTDLLLSAPDGPGTYLPHVYLTQFLSEKVAVVVGKLDTTTGDANAFAHGVGEDKFMNLAFSFNPVTLLTTPYSALGAGAIYMPNDTVTFGLTVFDSEGEIDSAGFDTLFDGATTYSVNMDVKTRFFDRPGTQRIAFLGSTGDYNPRQQDPRVLLPSLGVASEAESGSWAVAYNFDQYVGERWGIFGRVGVGDSDTNIYETFYSVGVGGSGLLPSRENDVYGVGLYYAGISDGLGGRLLDDADRGIELFYNIAVTPWFSLTADVQFLDPALKTSDTATVTGVRGKLRF